MSLSGNLKTMGLPEVLQWIATSRKTGTLYLRRNSVEKRIIFQSGALYSSWSNHPRESLGQFLVREGRVSEEQLFRALLKQEQHGQMLGAILVNEGVLSPDQLHEALRTKAEETIYDLFLWPDGEFQFRDGEFPEVFHLELPVTHVILEGIRRVDEWARIRAVFPSNDVVFEVDHGAAGADAHEARALELARTGRTLAEIALDMRRSEFDAATILFALHQRGVLRAGAARTAPAGEEDLVKAITGLLDAAAAAEREGRPAAALIAYEQVLARDRLNHTARRGAAAAREALDRAREAARIPLDRVPVLAMGLAALTRVALDPQEGFVLSRVNGAWDVRSILKICPIAEAEALQIFARLIERKVISLQ